jgi:putative acetyltransferase
LEGLSYFCSMIYVKRTDSSNPDFKKLVEALDHELWTRYKEEMSFYGQYNKIEKNNTVVIAYFDREPIGCACLKHVNDSTAELKRMFVKSEHRGKGIGVLMLDELETWARELSYSKIILETAIRQPEAIALYNKAGFSQTESYPPYEQQPLSICMAKKI